VTALLEQKDKSTYQKDRVLRRKRLLKVEMQFFGYFFSASAKKEIRFSRLMKVEKQFF
jgi:hypothetical protein